MISSGRYSDYNSVLGSWEDEKTIEEVLEGGREGRCHYLPHRGVFKEGSTTPLRPVFDAAKEELSEFVKIATDLMKLRSFELRGWENTSKDADSVPSSVLELLWVRKEDLLFCDTSHTDTECEPMSRRNVLSCIQKVFDPIGFTSKDLDNLDNVNLTKRLRYQQRLRNDLRKRFREEYLSLLVQQQINEAGSKQVEVGDVVLVGCNNKKRLDWPMGLVTEVFPGKDNSVRVVRVKTSKGELIRPVKRLNSLELNSDIKIYNSELFKNIRDNHSKIKNCNNQKDNANLGKDKEKNRTKIVKAKCGRNVIKPKRYDN
ncbi:DUF5641 domain-containing protein [Nephila pilipes]|uniref:DUF5641 domain-containing protein n=1 Tax=Nephila pilipes TaxID=299642 RepID=A0A8X6QD46_NEPPI|nr:DUF5641 domain-containing protein [Nephila pilipes]